MGTNFSCDFTSSSGFHHFWEHTVGSCHAVMALRADYQKDLTRCSKELGFKHVRFHAILSDDMGTLVDENDELVYSFFNADQIIDFLLSIGMKPFMELSFMPLTLSSGSETVFKYQSNVTPPKDYNLWNIFIKKLIEHWKDRYGIEEIRQWFFEVWNEPNLTSFWTGKQIDYFNLYKHTAGTIKSIDPALKVGGPATAKNEWLPEFINYCNEIKVPVDFISTHQYPTDALGKPGEDTIQELAESTRSILRDQAAAVKKQAGDKPVYYTEWSTSSNPFDELHDLPYAAAYITKTVIEAAGLVEGYSYWTFSDIFEENYFCSVPFHGGFGLMNIHGIPKPAYRAYELLHKLGENRFEVKGSHETVDVWAFSKQDSIQVLITNSQLPEHPVKEENITITLSINKKIKNSYIERIDDTHANATQAWYDMGRPESLLPKDLNALEKASSLIKEPVDASVQNNLLSLQVNIPPQGVACITIEYEESNN